MTDINQNGYVKSESQNGVTTIEFFHPQSNSLPGKILNELANAITDAGNNAKSKVIILKSAGEKAFCAGASFDELTQIKNETEGLEFFGGFAKVINALRLCPKFVIGRIQGKCVGGGVGIAAAVDYAIATEAAEVKLSELAVGIVPFVVGPAVERKTGAAAFSTMAIDATGWRSAKWANENGLFAELHTDSSNIDAAVQRLASVLSQSSPHAMAEMKKIFWEGTSHWDQLLMERAKISGRLVLSDFTKTAIEKFKSKK